MKPNSKLPSIDEIEKLHRKYAPNDKVYNLVYGHCQIVCEIALWCVDQMKDSSKVDKDLLRASCLLHDIGTYLFFDEEAKVSNDRMYVQHAILGSKILADEGIDSRICRLVQDHVLMGLSKEEIASRPFPLPNKDYIPDSIEGRLLCYGDRYHSKHPVFNSYDFFLKILEADLPLQAKKFKDWAKEFGIPDVKKLADKYQHPIR